MSFDIEPADVPRVSELLTMANARWGLDGDDQRAVGIEPLGTFTLLDALNRLVSLSPRLQVGLNLLAIASPRSER